MLGLHFARRTAALLVAALLAASSARAGVAPADSARVAPRLGHTLAWLAPELIAVGTIAAINDRDWSAAASRDRSKAAHDVAALGRQFGDPMVAAPVLIGADLLARAAGHPRIGAATERVALAAASASAVTLALGEALGRDRPDEPPGSPARFRPFSGSDALPSAHTTLAFALATSIAMESHAHARILAPALGAAAALTAWSRVHDRKHWPSDVVAGACVGSCVAAGVDAWAQRRLPDGLWVIVFPQRHGATARVGFAF